MTTAELLTDWMTNHEKERIKAQTYIRYQGLIDLHIVPKLGDTEINDLTRRQIHDFLMERKREGNRATGGSLSATSVNTLNIYLKSSQKGQKCENSILRIAAYIRNPLPRMRNGYQNSVRDHDAVKRTKNRLKVKKMLAFSKSFL